VIDDARIRAEAADACAAAIARGGTGGMNTMVIDLHVERAALLDRIAKLERARGLDRDTVPCAAPEEGGP